MSAESSQKRSSLNFHAWELKQANSSNGSMYNAISARVIAWADKKRELRIKMQELTLGTAALDESPQTVDEYYEQLYPSNAIVKYWIKFGGALRQITESNSFIFFMNLVILLAGTLVGLQTYESLSENELINKLDACVVFMFIAECIMKILSDPLRPHQYFVGPDSGWNNFDFLIVVSCLALPGNSGAAMRLLRLLRVLKLLRSSSQMQMIIAGLAAGMYSSMFVFVILFLVMYMWGAFGVAMFSKQDPVHFGEFSSAFETLYRMATLDGWSDILLTNFYGCDVYPSDGYVTASTLMLENRSLDASETLCLPKALPITSYIYFHSFVVIAFLILLSLLVGIMAIAMIGVIKDMAQVENNREMRAEDSAKRKLFHRLYSGAAKDQPTKLLLQERQRVFKMCKALSIAIGGEFDHKFRDKEAKGMKLKWGSYYVHFALGCRTISNGKAFTNFVACVIAFAGITVGLQADGRMEENAYLSFAIKATFIAEAAMKIIGELSTPWRYFEDPWNRFDFFVILVDYAVVRVARLLRVLKILHIIPKLQLIVNTILNSFSSIVYIGAILAICNFLFGVTGCVLFAANDPWHFGNIHLAMLTLFRLSTGEKFVS
jgi:voltage-gated sodium channel